MFKWLSRLAIAKKLYDWVWGSNKRKSNKDYRVGD